MCPTESAWPVAAGGLVAAVATEAPTNPISLDVDNLPKPSGGGCQPPRT